MWTERTTRRPGPRRDPGAPASLYRLLGEHAAWSRRTDERRRQRTAVLVGVTLIAVARAGIPALGDAVRTGLYAAYVARATDLSTQDGVRSTPAVTVNGTPVTGATLDAAVTGAAR